MGREHCDCCNVDLDGQDFVELTVKASWSDESQDWRLCRYCAELTGHFMNNMEDLRETTDRLYGISSEEDEDYESKSP